jgi:hypothetical protein
MNAMVGHSILFALLSGAEEDHDAPTYRPRIAGTTASAAQLLH